MSAGAVQVELRLPSVLEVMVGRRKVTVSGRVVGEALDAAYDAVPQLRYHLTDDSGELKAHVLCLLNGVALPREEVRATPLTPGDELAIHQAISGG